MPFKHPISIEVYSAADYAKIPQGYFLCETASGNRTLGHCGPLGLSWSVPRSASLTQKQIEQLAVVHLRFARSQPGVVRVGDVIAVDTYALDTFDGVF